MASKRLLRSLPSLLAKHRVPSNDSNLEPDAADSLLLPLEGLLDPTSPSSHALLSLPLPLSHLPPAPPAALSRYVAAHLPSPSFSATDLLRLLRRHLCHHPRLAPHDFRVFLWAASLPSFRHDHSTYEFMARSLAASARLPQLRLLLSIFLASPCPCAEASIFACPRLEPIFHTALHAFCSTGRLDDAAAAFDDLRRSVDSRPSPALYNVLLHGFVRWGFHDRALDLYEKMVHRDRVRPDVYTFNILIDSCCRASDVDTASNWFREMRGRGCEPNVVSFNTLISGFFREKRFKEGIGIAHEMLDLGCKFSVVTCEILLNRLCKHGRVSEAADLFVEFMKSGTLPEGFDCLVLVEALCREGRAVRALEVVELVWEKRADCMSAVTWTALIEGLSRSGAIDEAYRVMERMIQKGMIPDSITCNSLLEALCDIGRASDANQLRLLASRKGFESDGMTFRMLVQGFSREGRTREAKDVLDEMLDGGFIPNITTYNRLLDGLHKANRSL